MGGKHGESLGDRTILNANHQPGFRYGEPHLVYRGALLRPNCVGNPNLANPAADEYFDINAFNPIPAPGRIGNCGVGILNGPGTVTVAGGLSKSFSIRERMRVRFEATFTNLLNHPNFAPPAVDVSAPATLERLPACRELKIPGNRTGQLALRLDF